MGLKLKCSTKYGVEGEYWRIDTFNYFRTANFVEVILRLYINKESVDEAEKKQGSSLMCLDTQSFRFPADVFTHDMHPITEAYHLIKRHGYLPKKAAVGMKGDKNYKPEQKEVFGKFHNAESVLEEGQVEINYDEYLRARGK